MPITLQQAKAKSNDKIVKSNKNIIANNAEYLNDINSNGKKRPWNRHKRENIKIANLYHKIRHFDKSIISVNRLQSLEQCGNFLIFAEDIHGNRHLHGSTFCKMRTCPMCNWRRTLKLFGQVEQITDKILQDDSSTRFIFVTFTIKNCIADELSNVLNKMNKAFTYITSKNHSFVPAKCLKSNLLGYIKGIEITYNIKDNTYHPHIHCLMAVKSGYFGNGYIKKSSYQNMWKKALKIDYEPIVHVRNVDNKAKSVAEVAKYPTKLADILAINSEYRAMQVLSVLHKTMKGRRLTTFGGIFATIARQFKLESVDSDNVDLIHVNDDNIVNNPVKLILYKFNFKLGCYIN